VLKWLAKFLIVMALSASIGLHWVLLQSVAWSTMLADNLRTTSFTQAMQRTFDGKHPCCLCKAIASGKSSERKADANFSLKKFEFPLAKVLAPLSPPAPRQLWTRDNLFARVRLLPPPTPPPRLSSPALFV
jgi:hypothetical protein